MDPPSRKLPTSRSADVVIVGAGIMGCAAAYFLAKKGVSVVVLDKGRIAGQQSTRAWGFVRVQARDPAEIPLALESLRLWRGLEQELNADLEWIEGGCLFLAHDREGLSEQEAWLELARSYQLDTRLVSGGEVTRLIPGLSKPTIGGLYTPSDGQAEPRRVAPTFAQRAKGLGAVFLEGCGATAIERAGNRIIGVQSEGGEIRAPIVVVAAGASTRAVLASLDIDLPQQYVRGTVARTNSVTTVTPIAVTGFGVGFRQRRDGSFNIADELEVDVDLTLGHLRALELFLPGFVRHRKSFSLHINAASLADLRNAFRRQPADAPLGGPRDPLHKPEAWRMERAARRMSELFPSAGAIVPIEQWGALIDCTPDGLPVLDAFQAPSGLIVATGFTAHGFALGPVVGKLLNELVTDGRPSIDLHAFRFSRFAEGDVKLPYSL